MWENRIWDGTTNASALRKKGVIEVGTRLTQLYKRASQLTLVQ